MKLPTPQAVTASKATPQTKKSGESFRQTLSATKAPKKAAKTESPPSRTTVAATAKNATAIASATKSTNANLTTARAHHEKTAKTLTEVRTQTTQTKKEQAAERCVALITKELNAMLDEPSKEPKQTIALPSQIPMTPQPVAVPDDKPLRSTQAVALIAKIETFVRAQRPVMALTLDQKLGTQVEIERVAPNVVSLTLRGGSLRSAAVAQMQKELGARGLKIAALTIA